MFKKNPYKKLFQQIKKNSKIVLYGAGDIGKAIKDNLAKQRKDVEVVFFIDTSRKGVFEGLQVISPFDLKDYNDKYDQIIIASNHNRNDMYLVLTALRVNRKKIVKVPLDGVLRSIQDEKINNALKVFKENSDKKLYKFVSEVQLKTKNKEKHVNKIRERFKGFKELVAGIYPEEQYLEYTNKDAVEVAIDGGAFNGIHALIFLSEFKNVKKIYSFEPNYEDFKARFNSDIKARLIESSPNIELVEKGLWIKEDVLEFKSVATNKAASCICDAKDYTRYEGDILRIKTTSIDKFVKDNNIEKIDFIKLDVENSEIKVIEGAKNTILKDRPQMAISIYHSPEHFLQIPIILDELLTDYVFRLGHYSENYCETVMYAIPKELYKA
ncbi:MAG: FkbM family methyltransferase [Candidatus Gastranaerophilales bacterium]|nr:FkbM family methyltransferase [Candidatus Gastranaerophilales bacterium]